jgi:hypothetical protein
MQEGLKDLPMKEESMSTQEVVREEILTLNPLEVHQHCEVTTLRKDKNKNGKRNPKTQIMGKKERNLSKKKTNLEKLQEVTEKTL